MVYIITEKVDDKVHKVWVIITNPFPEQLEDGGFLCGEFA